jgi:FixJ family two-component response regulator
MARKLFISVVDDDVSIRASLSALLRAYDFSVAIFVSAEEYLASDAPSQTECLILDINMPGMGGRDLQQELRRRGLFIPTIFMTGNEGQEQLPLIDEEVVACLIKPFETTELLEAISAAVLLLANRAASRKP